jgi:GntR family transcriptional regulator/MocR family aminotransferase
MRSDLAAAGGPKASHQAFAADVPRRQMSLPGSLRAHASLARFRVRAHHPRNWAQRHLECMGLYLQLEGEGPLQKRLARALTQAILDGRLRAGERLPGSRTLAVDLGLARNTVVLALDELVARGLVQAVPRKGLIVNAQTISGQPSPAETSPQPAPELSGRARRLLASAADEGPSSPGTRLELEYGQPLAPPALLSAWRQALLRAAERMPPGYPDPCGHVPLRQALAPMLSSRRGLRVDPDELIIVSGAQQAFDLVAAALVDPGDPVVIEDPHYEGCRHAFEAAGARLLPVAVDADGLCVDQLPEHGARLVLVTPSHQFPTGALLSAGRRRHLLDWAARQHAWILEDDYDGEFHFGSAPTQTLHALDGGRSVIHVGTFSKRVFPALRLGYLIAPRPLQPALRALKKVADRGSSVIEQAALAELIGNGALERHLRRLARELGRRRDALSAALDQAGHGRISVHGEHAGMHVRARIAGLGWECFPALEAQAHRLGLRLAPIRPRWLPAGDEVELLIGFSAAPAAQLVAAARALCKAIDRVHPG